MDYMTLDDYVVSVSTRLEHQGLSDLEIDRYFLEHYGVKGQKWGVRKRFRDRSTGQKVGMLGTGFVGAHVGNLAANAVQNLLSTPLPYANLIGKTAGAVAGYQFTKKILDNQEQGQRAIREVAKVKRAQKLEAA